MQTSEDHSSQGRNNVQVKPNWKHIRRNEHLMKKSRPWGHSPTCRMRSIIYTEKRAGPESTHHSVVQEYHITAIAILVVFRDLTEPRCCDQWMSDTQVSIYSNRHLLFTLSLIHCFPAKFDTEGRNNHFPGKVFFQDLMGFSFSSWRQLNTSNVSQKRPGRICIIWLQRIRVPLTPEILKSSSSCTTISRLGSLGSEFLTWGQRKGSNYKYFTGPVQDRH